MYICQAADCKTMFNPFFLMFLRILLPLSLLMMWENGYECSELGSQECLCLQGMFFKMWNCKIGPIGLSCGQIRGNGCCKTFDLTNCFSYMCKSICQQVIHMSFELLGWEMEKTELWVFHPKWRYDWQQDELILPWPQKCLVFDGQQENKKALQCQVQWERGSCRWLKVAAIWTAFQTINGWTLMQLNSPCQGWSHHFNPELVPWSKKEQFHFYAGVHSVVAITNMHPSCNQTDPKKDSGKAMVQELASSVSLPLAAIGWQGWQQPWQHLQANVIQMPINVLLFSIMLQWLQTKLIDIDYLLVWEDTERA